MKIKYADAVEAAGEDVLRWFEACETEGECAEFAHERKDLIDSVAGVHAEYLGRAGAPKPDPLRVRPTEDGTGLDAVPFEVRGDAPDPLYTFDCSWCCGVDVLRARGRRPVGRAALPFCDFPRGLDAEVAATVYELDEVTPDGARLHGRVAVADYRGGWLVWLGGDLDLAEGE